MPALALHNCISNTVVTVLSKGLGEALLGISPFSLEATQKLTLHLSLCLSYIYSEPDSKIWLPGSTSDLAHNYRLPWRTELLVWPCLLSLCLLFSGTVGLLLHGWCHHPACFAVNTQLSSPVEQLTLASPQVSNSAVNWRKKETSNNFSDSTWWKVGGSLYQCCY